MKKNLFVFLLTVFVLSACGAPAKPLSTSTPTLVPVSTQTPLPLPTDKPTITSVPPTPTITPFPTVMILNVDGLLAEILSRGTIVVATNQDFQPQSFSNPAGQRPTDTKCASDQFTSAQLQGFDVDIAIQIGLRLGVETCLATPPYNEVKTGNWGDKWDIGVGSYWITAKRSNVLAFTNPYYYENGTDASAITIDYSHTLSIETLLTTINHIIDDMHSDGTVSALSIKWFGKDFSTK
jgi:ABC-type amino acid transport substrate-binding protein